MKRTSELILYRHMEHGELLHDLMDMLEKRDGTGCFRLLHRFIKFTSEYGLEGNLFQTYLTFLLVNHENPYSLACERRGCVDGSINKLAHHDFKILRNLFHVDFTLLQGFMPKAILTLLREYRIVPERGRLLNHTIRANIQQLSKSLASAEDAQVFGDRLTEFYHDFGVGMLGLHKAFRVEQAGGCHYHVRPIRGIAKVELSDLIGYENEKKKLVHNTEAFLHGRPANNCLLYGDAGTGKSSCIKAISNHYYDKGLRMIEIYKHQVQCLPSVISQIKNRNYRFILFLDDLSFEDFETEYKYLKAIIEGGLERKPDNILIYATSNRRHLIREKFSDKGELLDDLHKNDTVQEKLSLAARFGVSIYFGAPSPGEYEEIVRGLAKRWKVGLPDEQLIVGAHQWALHNGGLSGRTAQQFIDHLLGGKE